MDCQKVVTKVYPNGEYEEVEMTKQKTVLTTAELEKVYQTQKKKARTSNHSAPLPRKSSVLKRSRKPTLKKEDGENYDVVDMDYELDDKYRKPGRKIKVN